MAESLGSLVDKLSIVNCKLYDIQGQVNRAAEVGVGLDADTTHKLVALNRQRTGLMNEINALFGGEQIVKT